MALITVKDLAAGYGSEVVAEHISFEVAEGDYLCIIGENGAGKSTLMRTVLGLLKPISGTIEFGDGLKQNEIGYLPQQTQIQKDFPASVSEIVISGYQGRCGMRPFYSKSEKEGAKRNIARMGIEDLASRCYRDLSGGQQQRVLLARALCATEKILLMDEPVSGLDPDVTEEMYALIRKMNESGIAVIMISHDIDAALKEATHILRMGRDVFFGTKEEYEAFVKGGGQQ